MTATVVVQGMAWYSLAPCGHHEWFRCLGYAVTGLLMQARLVILIGPVVPFYRVAEVFMFVVTTFMIASNAASRRRWHLNQRRHT